MKLYIENNKIMDIKENKFWEPQDVLLEKKPERWMHLDHQYKGDIQTVMFFRWIFSHHNSTLPDRSIISISECRPGTSDHRFIVRTSNKTIPEKTTKFFNTFKSVEDWCYYVMGVTDQHYEKIHSQSHIDEYNREVSKKCGSNGSVWTPPEVLEKVYPTTQYELLDHEIQIKS